MCRAYIWCQFHADYGDRVIWFQALHQYYEARAEPGELISCAVLVAVAVAVCFHSRRSVPRADIWYQFQADCRDIAIGMHPGMLQALQAIL